MSKKKQLVEERANRCCEYCLCQASFCPDPFSMEHIIPISKGGTNELDNLAYSYQGCNNRKYNVIEAIDPVSGNTTSLYHPRKENWKTHFKWTEDFSRLVGLTPYHGAFAIK